MPEVKEDLNKKFNKDKKTKPIDIKPTNKWYQVGYDDHPYKYLM